MATHNLNLPAGLPSIANAKLPAVYANAKTALAQCERIDECKDWADKAAALASYAKQADDKSLHRMATRIQVRAIQRCGDLLKQIDAAKNQHDAEKRSRLAGVGGGPSTRREAGKGAGLSERQQKTAVRVANVPKDEFEAAVEQHSQMDIHPALGSDLPDLANLISHDSGSAEQSHYFGM